VTKQFISYDTTGGNEDGGFDKFQRYIDENGEWVIFEEIGAGCLYRMQMNIWWKRQFDEDMGISFEVYQHFSEGVLPVDASTRIKFYFDHAAEPMIDETTEDFFGRSQKYMVPFDDPFMVFDAYLNGFAINYYPFAFKRHLKITMTPQQHRG